MRRTLALILCTVMMLGIFSACESGGGGKADKMLKVVMTEDPTTIDVQKTTVYYAIPLNIYDRLVECVTENGAPKLIPGLAEKWDVTPDGLVYTFHLRKDVKFHNGEVFKADDVVYTINRMMNPENETVNTDFFDMIQGAMAVYNEEADEVSGVRVIDDYTIEITLEYPFGAFLANLATPPASIYNRKAGEAAGDDFGIDPEKTVGSGPFMLSEWTLNNKIVLETFDDYWRGASPLDGVTFMNIPDEETQRMSFEKGEIDVFDVSYAKSQLPYFQASDKWKDKITQGPEAGLYFYLFNVEYPPYDDVNVRKAIAHAIDRELILETLYNGEGWVVDCMVVDGVLGHNPNLPKIEYNPDLARQYLADAGYPNGGLKCEILMTTEPGMTETDMNVAIQSMLKEIGIEMEIVQVDPATYYQMRSEGKMPLERNAWWVDYNDPDNFLYTYFSEKKSPYYSINYMRREVLDLLENARKEVDEQKRLGMYQEAERMIVSEDQVIIPMFQLSHLYILQDRVKDFVLSWNGWSDQSYYGIDIVNPS